MFADLKHLQLQTLSSGFAAKIFGHLKQQFPSGSLWLHTPDEGFQFQDFYTSEDCVSDVLNNPQCFPSPERFLFSKFKLVL
jgi:hypothetical protein